VTSVTVTTRVAVLLMTGGLSLSPPVARAQPATPARGSTAEELRELRAQNARMIEELKAIRALLERIAAGGGAAAAGSGPPSGPVKLGPQPTDFVLGNADAPLTLVEFTDLQCPFCRQFTTTAFEDVRKAYIDTGLLRFVSRDLPLEAIHPLAMPAARASRCAARQKKGWEMRRAILVNNANLSIGMFATMAADLGLDMVAFAACTNDLTTVDASIRTDMADAAAARIDGTPSFVLGRTAQDGLEGVIIPGALPFAEFERQIKAMLGQRSP